MTVKDILVHLDNTATAHQRVISALQVAEKYNAHVTGMYVYRPIVFPAYSEVGMPAYIYSELESREIERVNEIKTAFEKWTQHWKDRTSWIAREGDPASIIAQFSGHHDLVYMGQGLPGEREGEHTTTLNRVIVESPSPVMVVPASNSKKEYGKRILIAWNGKKEAARAVRDALPFLQAAEAVEVVSVNTAKNIDIPCIDIAEHLARHGVNVNGGNADTKSRHTGEAILYMAQNFGADMIVMGAYGHSRLREYILGGATRHVLERANLPVLLSH